VGVADAARKSVFGQILDAVEAEGVAALREHRRKEQLQANGTSKNFLIQQRTDSCRIGMVKWFPRRFPD
jgi:hypothetical protein